MKLLSVFLSCLLTNLAFADEAQITLKPGAGIDKVTAYCSACHSLDYIQMNSPFLDRKLWDAEVNKMVNAFGAPIPKEDISTIVDYLTQQYGKQ
jgi:sulfite dehydrogenase (cytochrome) subunit B